MTNNYSFKKTMCLFLAIVSLVTVLVVFGGCSSPETVASEQAEQTEQLAVSTNDTNTTEKIGMEEVYRGNGFVYYRELTTDVMYVEREGYREYSLTPMLSPRRDGGPLLYSVWCNMQPSEG